jgi:membrane-bound serine protease (ClpP class)
LLRSYRQKAATGDEGMIGLVGLADTEIHANGRIKIRGEYWNARSTSPVAAGKPVKVLAIEKLTLIVEEVKP